MRQNARSDGTAIRFCAFELNLNPVLFPREVVSHERRRFVEVDDDHVDVTVIIEISEGATAAAMRGGNARAGFADQLFKYALPQVSENRARSLVRVLGELLLDLRVNMAGRHEQVRIAVVIQINNPRAPTHVTRLDPQARGRGGVLKVRLSIVTIKNVPIIGEVRLEDIEVPIQIIIAHCDAHARLRQAVVVQGHAPQKALFAKRSIVVVHEKKARSGIASDVNVRPAIFIKIGCYHRQTVTRSHLRDARGFTYIRERPVAVVSIKPVTAGGQPARPARDRNPQPEAAAVLSGEDRKSTRLNSSHTVISYAVFCLKKKKKEKQKLATV